MKFRITRTSQWDWDKAEPCLPHHSAVVESKRLTSVIGEKNLYSYVYSIEINSLRDLIELVQDEGEIIIGRNSSRFIEDTSAGNIEYALEIYDDFRE